MRPEPLCLQVAELTTATDSDSTIPPAAIPNHPPVITEEATSADTDSNKARSTEEAESGFHRPSDTVRGSCLHDAFLHTQLPAETACRFSSCC